MRAPGKVNLSLRVGPRRPDGYHPVATVFQAVSVYEDVVASRSDDLRLTVSGPQADLVPTDESNLALRAARALAERTGIDDGIHLHLHKSVPVAGGMADQNRTTSLKGLLCVWSGKRASRQPGRSTRAFRSKQRPDPEIKMCSDFL